jgi:hypothetical protein
MSLNSFIPLRTTPWFERSLTAAEIFPTLYGVFPDRRPKSLPTSADI